MTKIPEPAFAGADWSRDVPSLVRIVQGVLLHAFWTVSLSPERSDERHLRSVAQMIDHIRMLEDQPLSVCSSANARLIVVCRHFTVLFAALLHETGIPARGRSGFGTYFRFVDHWVCEYWNAPEARWVLVDAFIATPQREKLRPDFDPLDVPRDRFVVAGDAWALCRVGNINPSAFGIRNMSGMWFVARSLMRDLAALNKMEMLPWDVWGVMPREGWSPTHDQLALFDRVASQTRTPDAAFGELRESYADDRVRVPAIVFNALRRRSESV